MKPSLCGSLTDEYYDRLPEKGFMFIPGESWSCERKGVTKSTTKPKEDTKRGSRFIIKDNNTLKSLLSITENLCVHVAILQGWYKTPFEKQSFNFSEDNSFLNFFYEKHVDIIDIS